MARQAPATEKAARMIPRTSSKERNSTGFGKQASFSAFGHSSSGQAKQSGESEKKKQTTNNKKKKHKQGRAVDTYLLMYIFVKK